MVAPDRKPPGPFRDRDIGEGDPLELSDGHKIHCMTAGVRHGQAHLRGASVIASDPDVDYRAGVDVGVSFNDGKNLRAPDVSVGIAGDEHPGWATEVPPLAVEYADIGQNNADLTDKIDELLSKGTRYVWVVRLVGERRVEIHEPGQPVRTASSGDTLSAPGVLKNPIPVDALYDRDAARRATLNNNLQAEGYADLNAVLDAGKKLGIDEGKRLGIDEGKKLGGRAGVRDLCEVLGIEISPAGEQALATMDLAELDTLSLAIKRDRRWPERA